MTISERDRCREIAARLAIWESREYAIAARRRKRRARDRDDDDPDDREFTRADDDEDEEDGEEEEPTRTCPRCNGTGRVPVDDTGGDDEEEAEEKRAQRFGTSRVSSPLDLIAEDLDDWSSYDD